MTSFWRTGKVAVFLTRKSEFKWKPAPLQRLSSILWSLSSSTLKTKYWSLVKWQRRHSKWIWNIHLCQGMVCVVIKALLQTLHLTCDIALLHGLRDKHLFKSRFVLVPRGRTPFGQHQESRPLERSSEIPFLNGLVNTVDWDQNQSDLSDSTQSMRRVTGSSWIADVRCWTRLEIVILGADQRSVAPGEENDQDIEPTSFPGSFILPSPKIRPFPGDLGTRLNFEHELLTVDYCLKRQTMLGRGGGVGESESME